MRGNEFLEKMSYIDNDLIEAAGVKPEVKTEKLFQRKKESMRPKWKTGNKWVAAVAGLCLVLTGAYMLFFHGSVWVNRGGHGVQQWSVSLAAKDYFKYNGASKGNDPFDKSDYQPPYVTTRFFSDEQEQLEHEGIIPVMENHPLFDCMAHYNEDGSLYSLVFSWQNRDDKESYSDLTITAGYQEVEQITDCVVVEVDENGTVLEPAVTVTERDGIQIIAKGSKNQNKTLTFQNQTGWYQIEASWNDDYDDMVMLLDWLWEHPIDFERFLQ